MAVLTVTVQHIAPKGGDLRLALYDEKSFSDDNAPGRHEWQGCAGQTLGRSRDTRSGAARAPTQVKMFQDVNRNGKFDFNLAGYSPPERYGFSNNGSARLDASGPAGHRRRENRSQARREFHFDLAALTPKHCRNWPPNICGSLRGVACVRSGV